MKKLVDITLANKVRLIPKIGYTDRHEFWIVSIFGVKFIFINK